MVYEQYDFARNPIVENRIFFLESKCIRCGSSVLARSLEELLQEEKRHRALCRLMRATQ
jgi:ribosomal protein S27AE